MQKEWGKFFLFSMFVWLKTSLWHTIRDKIDSYIWLRCYIYPFGEIRGIGVSKIMKTRQINVSVWYDSWTMKYSIVNAFLKHSA